MRILQLSVLLAALVAGPAFADSGDRPPDWVKTPSARDLAAVWPAAALKSGVGGKAVISCVVTVQGLLRECRVVSEDPPGVGFGSAAIALTPQFLMRPALRGGTPVEATVNIPLNFPRPDRATGSYLRPVTDTPFQGVRVYARLPWSQAPTYAEVMAAYPAKARAAKVGGVAVLDCRIEKPGSLSTCRVIKEAPQGYGFGDAARGLARRFVGPTVNGQGETMDGSHVNLAIGFAAEALETAAPTIGRPEWAALPSAADFTAAIPPAARKASVFKARVVMNCTVGAGGALDGCQPESEDPAGLGYADAAVLLSRHFRVAVWTDEGLPTVGGRVRVPLRFDLEDAMKAKAEP